MTYTTYDFVIFDQEGLLISLSDLKYKDKDMLERGFSSILEG
jgi:hypothetical protein